MEIIVETYVPYGEASSADVRVRPLPGQSVDPALNVACSRSIREQFPVGSLFRLAVKVNYRKGTPYLYAYYAAPFEHVSVDEARRFITVVFGFRPTGNAL